MYSQTVIDAHGKLLAKRNELKEIHTLAKEKGLTDEQRDQLKALNREVGDLSDNYNQIKAAEDNDIEIKKLNEPVNQFDTSRVKQVKSLGDRFIDSDAWKEAFGRGDQETPRFKVTLPDFSWKASITTTAGLPPANNRLSDIVPYANRIPLVAGTIPIVETNVDTVKYLEQTTFTNTAAEVAEDSALSQSAFAYTERTKPIELLGHYVTVTQQQVEVPEFAVDVVNNDLMLGWNLKLDSQLLSGNGSTPQILGLYNVSGINTYALTGTDTNMDALYNGIYKCQTVGFANPDTVLIHPANVKAIILEKDANDNYIWGSPSDNPGSRIWGVNMVATTAATSGSAIVGDFSGYVRLYMKKGITLETGFVDQDFIKNRYSIKATGRLCLVVRRAAALSTVTSLT